MPKIVRRGAPFKGQVSNNREEGHKVQRQKTIREFKSFYEKRKYLRYLKESKKKREFRSNEELEAHLRQITAEDISELFDRNLFLYVDSDVKAKLTK